MASTAAWADDLVGRLLAAGYREVPTSPGLVGARAFRRSEFRISWLFSRLHTFIIVWVGGHVAASDVATFSRTSVRWAKQNKGGLPVGFQTGVAALPVAVCEGADQAAVDEAARRPDKHFAAIELPILAHPDSGKASTYSGQILWGLVYQRYLGDQQRLILDGLRGATMPGPSSPARLMLVATTALVVVGMLVLIGMVATFLY